MSHVITTTREYLSTAYDPDDTVVLALVHKPYTAAAAELHQEFSALFSDLPYPSLPDAYDLVHAKHGGKALHSLWLAHPTLRHFRPIEQRTAQVRHISTRYASWLRYMNSQRYEVYLTPNSFLPGSHGRKKGSVAEIHYLYLDFDSDGQAALARLQSRPDIPAPNFVVSTSPGKYQVLWKIGSASPDDAEAYLRALARHCGADIAATDSTRVLRLPGFMNYKYQPPHFVSALHQHDSRFSLADFPPIASLATPQFTLAPALVPAAASRRNTASPAKSRSEEDLCHVLSFLRRSEGPPGHICGAAIEKARATLALQRSDKPNPQYYADLTVSKAAAIIAASPRRQLHR